MVVAGLRVDGGVEDGDVMVTEVVVGEVVVQPGLGGWKGGGRF